MGDTHRIPQIDTWRFIAVSMVFIAHLITSLNERLSIEIVPAILRHGAFGHLGVLIFFFISGFVICRGLMVEQAAFSTISLKAFYIRRAFRIVPALYLYLAVVGFVVYMGWVETGFRQLIKSALFLCNMDKGVVVVGGLLAIHGASHMRNNSICCFQFCSWSWAWWHTQDSCWHYCLSW
jgi:peptidoglycan/LPS O-acetylase OafA/YrhL